MPVLLAGGRFLPQNNRPIPLLLGHPMTASAPEAAALASYFSRHPEALAGSGRVFVFRALPGDYLRSLQARPLALSQTLKPAADALAGLGFDPLAAPAAPLALAIVFATKHKEEVLYHLALAAEALEEGGSLIVAAANDLGAGSLEKRCAGALGAVESYSKHKCRVFLARKHTARLDPAALAAWRRGGELQPMAGTGLWSRPGLFSWKGIDAGSRFLAGQLPDDLAGCGADLGAGYGYLARDLLARAPGVTGLHLVEAEWKALEAARRNLAAVAGSTDLQFHWRDVTAGLPLDRLDFVVMNPPFHAGRQAVPALGRAFVRAGLAALRPGGRLFLVANRHLPYEDEIDRGGGRPERRAEAGGFKVLAARKA
jgi:16S rRNA (guanine1207-N2)-methyltransferase